MTQEYLVHIDAFAGPLDLLLYLIRRAEVDIHDIPVATIADQYLGYLEGIEAIDIDLAGEFLVMAATLTEIKARMLAPPPPTPEGTPGTRDQSAAAQAAGAPAEDPRTELVRQLLEYKRFRDAAEALETRRRDWERRYPAGRATADAEALSQAKEAAAEAAVELDDVSLSDLTEAFARILSTVDFNRLGEHRVVMDDTPIEIHAEDILDRLRRAADGLSPDLAGAIRGTLRFAQIFEGRGRAEMIGLFLAMLELVRQRRIEIKQDEPGADITVALAPDSPAAEVAAEGPPASEQDTADAGAEQ